MIMVSLIEHIKIINIPILDHISMSSGRNFNVNSLVAVNACRLSNPTSTAAWRLLPLIISTLRAPPPARGPHLDLAMGLEGLHVMRVFLITGLLRFR